MTIKRATAQIRTAPGPETVNTLLVRLIQLAAAVLAAGTKEKAAGILVNQIQTLVPVDRALVIPLYGRKRILAMSGGLEPNQDNAFAQGVHEVRTQLRDSAKPRVLERETMPRDVGMPYAHKILKAMNGTRVLWLPLPGAGPDAPPEFALWLERWHDKAWGDEEIKLIANAAVFFARGLHPNGASRRFSWGKKIATGLTALLLILALLIPFPVHVSAPVLVQPSRPYYVFAPFDGIVRTLAVRPGQSVRKGDLVLSYDKRVLEKRLEEARRDVAVARAELSRLQGAAYRDEDARASIPVQKLEVERREAQVTFMEQQMTLSDVRAGASGIVILDDPDALLGASLQTGQMIMRIADPERTELRIMVPVSDAGLVQEGTSVSVRLDSTPLKALPARVAHIGFDVRLSDEDVPSVLIKAKWDRALRVSPGQRGTARIKGPSMPLGVQVLRKPLIALRTRLGI